MSAVTWKAGGATISQAPPAAPQTRPRHITRLAFSRRFSVEEEADIDVAIVDTPTGPPPARKALARARVAARRASLAPVVNLDDPELRATVQGYESAGLLAAGRALVILDAPILESERP